MSQFTAYIVIFSVGFQSVAFAAAPPSEAEVQAMVRSAVARAVVDSPTLCRRALRQAFSWKIRKNAVKQLAAVFKNAPDADPSLLELQTEVAVRKAVESVDFLPRQAVGGAMLFGVMGANAQLTVWLLTQFPDAKGFIAMMISQFSILSVNYFGAPFLEPLSAKIRGFGFWVFPSLQKYQNKGIVSPIFQQIYQNLQAFTTTQQVGAMRIQSHLSYLENRMSRAFQGSLLIQDPDKQRRFVVEQLAVAALWTKVLSPDVPVDSGFSLIAVRSNFTDFYEEKEGLPDAVYARVQQLHEKFYGAPADQEAQAYYRLLVDTWYR